MTSNTFYCHICHVVLADNESTVTKHISSFHLNYRPYNCRTCYGEGNIFKAATEEGMDAHIAILHGATNYGYHAIKDQTKEIELKTAVEQYRRVSTLQHSSANTRIDWHQNTAFYRPAHIHENVQEPRDSDELSRRIFITLGGTSTDTESILAEGKQKNPEKSKSLKSTMTTNKERPNKNVNRPADIHENVQEVGGTSTDTESILTEVKQENPESEIEIIEMDNDDEQREAKQEREQTSTIISATDEFCPYSSSNKEPVTDHMRTHISEKPYKCTVCSFACAHNIGLVEHLHTHANEKHYKCNLCSYASNNKTSLTIHFRTHTGEKPFKCSLCSFAFSDRRNFTRHMRTHTNEKPYKCSFCSYACTQSNSLKEHVRTHTGEKPYKCPQCIIAFASSSHLSWHMRMHHSLGKQ